MRPKRGMGRSGRVIAGAAGVVAVAVAAVAVVFVLGAVGLPGSGAMAIASRVPAAAVTSTPSSAAPAGSSPSSASPSPTSSATAPSTTPSPSTVPSPSAPPPSPSAVPSASPTAVPAAKLDGLLDRLRSKTGIPGVSAAILWNDGRSWTGASGLRDVAGGRPMTTGTGFSLASISKTYTGAVVLELVGEGKLSLEQPVAPLLPAFHLDRRITLRMLLDHTSGLPDFFFGPGIDAALQGAPDAAWTPLVAWRYLPRKHAIPGTAWSYANTNYLLLGEVVQAVTGHTLAREIRTRLLAPLGLASTWYQVKEAPKAPLSAGYRMAPQTGGGRRAIVVAPASDVMPFRSVVTAAGGAGSIAATALDTALWMQAYARGRVLSPVMQRAMIGDVVRTALLRAAIPYGLGIQEVLLAGHEAIGHAGRFLGFRTVVRYLPDLGITIAVLTNQGDDDPSKIAAALVQAVAPPAPAPPASGPPSASGSPAPSAPVLPPGTPSPSGYAAP